MNTAGPTAIAVGGVRKRYGAVEALKGVELDVRPGEIFGLIGANGAGKSTLIKLLVGTTRPTEGTVRVLGLDPLEHAAALRRQIGYMPQVPALYEDLSPRDNVRFFGAAHSLADLDARVDEVIAFTNLTSRANDAVFGFSGGMKQRVSLACALAHEPRLLLLDEPTAGIDPKLREAFWEHFRRLASSGVTLLVSTHLMDEALLCDRVAVMRDGVVLASDAPKELLRRGRTRVTIRRGEKEVVETLVDYRAQLPQLLRRHGLDAAVTRIDLDEDTLETVVLGLIDAREERRATAPAPQRGYDTEPGVARV
ncbi:MAG TPA: ABC transporter ATP-binding protein [Chloroflexota bacterium]|nr:ABC transporter ATP-binding protein [Chloroflexota bacterium]